MKKALLAALCFIIVSLIMVNGTFAFPEFDKVFQSIAALFDKGAPEQGGAGTPLHVELISDDQSQLLYPGGRASRSFHVRNSGEGNAYFRLVYAVEYNAESWNKLEIQFDAGEGFIAQDGWKDISISGRPYKMKVFTYTEALPSRADSPEVILSIAMDASITDEQMADYHSDFLQIQVLAIDPAPFTERNILTAEEALDAALPLDTLNPF